jgi:RNA polymerase sigma factor (sigma-70 family)
LTRIPVGARVPRRRRPLAGAAQPLQGRRDAGASRRFLALASDERLTQEMRRGSEAAFEVTYQRHSRHVLALCRHMLGSHDEAEDALQQTFSAAWSDLQRQDRPAPEMLKPWLYAVARHRCLSMLRSRRPSTVELEDVPSTTGLADEVGRRADLRALLSDLGDLPEEQRTALVLSELAGLSHADIADVLDRHESGVKALVYQARTTLGDWREARDTPCEDIREQLSVLRGGALRRRALRRHLHACSSCREFRAEVKAQRRGLALVLPVVPSLGLERGVLAAAGLKAAAGGAGGAAGGGAAAGIGAASVVSAGSAMMATVTLVGVIAGSGTKPGHLAPLGRERAGASQTAVVSPAKDRALQSARALPSPAGRRILVSARSHRSSERSPRHRSRFPAKRPNSSEPKTKVVGSPRPEQLHSQTRTRPKPKETPPTPEATDPKVAKASQARDAKIAQASQERDAKVATANQERDAKIVSANQERDANIAEANRKAAGKGPKEQQKAQEKIAKAIQDAQKKIAQANKEAQDKIAAAIQEANEKIAKAIQEAQKKAAKA